MERVNLQPGSFDKIITRLEIKNLELKTLYAFSLPVIIMLIICAPSKAFDIQLHNTYLVLFEWTVVLILTIMLTLNFCITLWLKQVQWSKLISLIYILISLSCIYSISIILHFNPVVFGNTLVLSIFLSMLLFCLAQVIMVMSLLFRQFMSAEK